MQLRESRRIGTIIATASVVAMLIATPALAGKGGSHGPCQPGTPLAGETLGGDVSYVARHGGVPLPQHFAFAEGPPPMPPGQLMKFARSNGLC